jgi:hypothetical protein
MGSRPRLVAARFSKLPSALKHEGDQPQRRRGGVGQAQSRAECAGQVS